jgi:hypothetical protein
MEKVKVRLVQLGSPLVDLEEVSKWSSEFFEIVGVDHVPELPDSDLDDPPWGYSDNLLKKLVEDGAKADIKMGVIHVPLEHDFFMRRLSDHACVLTLQDMAGYMTAANIPLEIFVVRNLYEMVLLYLEFNGTVHSDAHRHPHEDTRGCLYDFAAYKFNAVWSTKSVRLCTSCKSRLTKKQLPIGFVGRFERELKRIKKPAVFAAIDFIKSHPVWSVFISAGLGLALNILAGIIYVLWLKRFFE